MTIPGEVACPETLKFCVSFMVKCLSLSAPLRGRVIGSDFEKIADIFRPAGLGRNFPDFPFPLSGIHMSSQSGLGIERDDLHVLCISGERGIGLDRLQDAAGFLLVSEVLPLRHRGGCFDYALLRVLSRMEPGVSLDLPVDIRFLLECRLVAIQPLEMRLAGEFNGGIIQNQSIL